MTELVQWSSHSDKERPATFMGGEEFGREACPACGRKGLKLVYQDLAVSPDYSEIVRARLWRWPLVFSSLRHIAIHEKVAAWIVDRGFTGFGLHAARLISPEVRRAIATESLHRMATPKQKEIIEDAGIFLDDSTSRSRGLASEKPSLKFAPRYFVVEPLGACSASVPEGLFDECPECLQRVKKVPAMLKSPLEADRGSWDGMDLVRETAIYPWLKYLRRDVAEEFKEKWSGWFSFSGGGYGIHIVD